MAKIIMVCSTALVEEDMEEREFEFAQLLFSI